MIVNSIQLWQYRVYLPQSDLYQNTYIEARWRPGQTTATVITANIPYQLKQQQQFNRILWRGLDLLDMVSRRAKPDPKRLEEDPDSPYWTTIVKILEYKQQGPTAAQIGMRLGIADSTVEKYLTIHYRRMRESNS